MANFAADDTPGVVVVWYRVLGIVGAVLLTAIAIVLLRARRAAPPLLPRLASTERALHWVVGGVVGVGIITTGVGAGASWIIVMPLVSALGSIPLTFGHFKVWMTESADPASSR